MEYYKKLVAVLAMAAMLLMASPAFASRNGVLRLPALVAVTQPNGVREAATRAASLIRNPLANIFLSGKDDFCIPNGAADCWLYTCCAGCYCDKSPGIWPAFCKGDC